MFIELKAKSNFSFLKGASDSREYILRAKEIGMPAIGITDINGVYSLPRAYEAIRDYAPEIKLICGTEITVQDHPPLTLLAKNRKAYGLMCRIITQVHAGKEKGEGFITLPELVYMFEKFEGGKDLVCIPNLDAKPEPAALNLAVLKELFLENLYLPLCRYLDGLDRDRTKLTLDIAKRFNLPLIATNDVHYHHPNRRPLQDSMTCIREGVTMDTAGFHLFGNEERYLKSSMQMQSLFYDLPEAISNTSKIADECTFTLSELKYTYPHEFIPPGETAKSYLEKLVFEGAHETYRGLIPPKVDSQIRRELDFFARRGDEHYFLTVQDIVRFAREKNILCQGRGSAANSIVCYVLGITSVDPVHMNLLFDRFMNEGRKEPPDIDIDFEHNRREEVIQYIYNRFGRERAAMVAAIRTYRRKSAFLELSKAVGIEVGTISAGELELRFDELAGDKVGRKVFVEELSKQLKGFPRHISIHSGGFVLSNDPLVEMVPIEPARMEGRTIIQWDKEDLETLGLMKIDVLSIGFLTALHEATDLAGISWRDIPSDDKKTFAMIRKAETHGTFQIESRAQMNMLPQTLPENYYDLVVQVALVRPSPSKGGMVQPFLRGLRETRRGNKFKIGNADLERILGRTSGIPIFQEQIMEISIAIAGFTPAESDQLRRSLGKQRSAASVDAMGKKLYEALTSKGIPQKFADDLFSYIQGYAHYGFPESHAASYASLAYKSAYMKCHYPAELLVGLINSQPMGFYPVDSLINEAKRTGVQVLPVHPNLSLWGAKLEAPSLSRPRLSRPQTVRMGFCNIKRINEDDVLAMLEERKKKLFTSVEDFIARTQFSKEVLENLSMANFFESFGLDRRHTYWKSIEFGALFAKRSNKKQSDQQLMLFDENTKLDAVDDIFTEMSMLEKITTDYRKMGYSLEGNMMKGLRIEMPYLPGLLSTQIRKMPKGKQIIYAGIVTVIQRPPPANGTAFMTFEDEYGSIDTIVRPEIYEKYEQVILSSRFLIIEGKVQKKGLGTNVLVSRIESFADGTSKKPNGPRPSPRTLGKLDWRKLADEKT